MSLRDIKNAPSRVSVIQKKTKMTGFEKLAPTKFFKEFVFHQNEATVLKITHEKLLQIIDIVNKCAMKRETETYLTVFSYCSDSGQLHIHSRN